LKPLSFGLLLVLSSCVLILGEDRDDGNELPILRDSSGEISILHMEPDGPTRKIVANGVSFFNISRSGHFVMKDKTGWYKGSINSSLVVRKRPIESVAKADQHSSAGISEDGKRIAWAIGDFRTDLIVYEYNDDQTKLLLKISTEGIILGPSLSPDGRKLAYYYGPPGAEIKDGFSLMLLNVDEPDSKPSRIAPPSLPTSVSPSRAMPPIWSPDGQSILFEASYSSSMERPPVYMVSINSGRLTHPPIGQYGNWDREGKRLYEYKREDNDSNGSVTELDVSSDGIGIKRNIHYVEMTDKLFNSTVSPSARTVAFVRMNKEIILYDTMTNQSISFGPVKGISGRVIFINPIGQK
jgi:hypothetical protein